MMSGMDEYESYYMTAFEHTYRVVAGKCPFLFGSNLLFDVINNKIVIIIFICISSAQG